MDCKVDNYKSNSKPRMKSKIVHILLIIIVLTGLLNDALYFDKNNKQRLNESLYFIQLIYGNNSLFPLKNLH